MATIEIKGVDEIIIRLKGIQPAVTAAIKRIAMEIKGKISIYPPQVEGAIYQRTDKLKHAWTMESRPMAATIGNNTSYGPKVQDREEQTYMHLFDGWRTVQDYAEEYQPKVTEMIHESIQTVLEK